VRFSLKICHLGRGNTYDTFNSTENRKIYIRQRSCIQYDTAYLTCSKELMDGQPSLADGMNKNVKEKKLKKEN